MWKPIVCTYKPQVDPLLTYYDKLLRPQHVLRVNTEWCLTSKEYPIHKPHFTTFWWLVDIRNASVSSHRHYHRLLRPYCELTIFSLSHSLLIHLLMVPYVLRCVWHIDPTSNHIKIFAAASRVVKGYCLMKTVVLWGLNSISPGAFWGRKCAFWVVRCRWPWPGIDITHSYWLLCLRTV